jgi:hypothetical protein
MSSDLCEEFPVEAGVKFALGLGGQNEVSLDGG